MIIQYLNPFSRAFKRMKIILFKPFNLSKWFLLGFTAFLAGFFGSPGGIGGGSNFKQKQGNLDFGDFFDLPGKAVDWLSGHPFWMAVIIAGIVIVIVVAVVLTWLSSRGMFMFLDNVVHNRSLIEKPWRDFKTQGDSLFLWRVAFGIICFIISIGFIVAAFLVARNIYHNGDGLGSHLMLMLGFIFIGLLLLLVMSFISLFLKDFIVPIIYKTSVTVNDAWRKFLALFGQHAGHFILYGFFKVGLLILVVIGVLIGGLLTCCCGFILLIIPYIGSVLMLPVSVTFRALSLEFLEQFGDEYKVFPGDSIETDFVFAPDENIDPVV
jgi:hypothetical protein